jgi:hypothetical protein
MIGALVLALLPVARASAQTPPTFNPDLPNPLPTLPRPPDTPTSLYLPPSSPPQVSPLPGPYFEEDPRLDPPELPPPGWFSDVGLAVIGAHFKNHLVDTVQLGGPSSMRTPDIVHVAPAELDWTVAPRIELGYRLPSGFGEVGLAYRSFATQGTGLGPAADGLAALKSRLDLNEIDFDYQSWEFSLWPRWDMKWFLGGRLTYFYYDATAREALAEAATGSGVFATGSSNSYVGFGPHFGLELARKLAESGLAVVGRTDMAIHLGRIRQGFFEQSTLADASGRPPAGETRESSSQAVPMINTQLGMSWRPPAWRDVSFFAGYEYEYWWNVGRLSKGLSRGELSDQGVALRMEFNF